MAIIWFIEPPGTFYPSECFTFGNCNWWLPNCSHVTIRDRSDGNLRHTVALNAVFFGKPILGVMCNFDSLFWNLDLSQMRNLFSLGISPGCLSTSK